MPQSLSFLLVHIVFSTKDRRRVFDASVLPQLHAYLATVARDQGCDCYGVGGVADHVHLAIRLHPTVNLADLVKELKIHSSIWLKRKAFPRFAWQRGYGAFSVGPADSEALLQYIEAQEAHHRKRSFQDEMRAYFKKYHVAFDERYVWD